MPPPILPHAYVRALAQCRALNDLAYEALALEGVSEVRRARLTEIRVRANRYVAKLSPTDVDGCASALDDMSAALAFVRVDPRVPRV